MVADRRTSSATDLPPRIAAVAICYRGKVWTLPPPARHHNVIRLIADETGETHIDCRDRAQGFIDTEGRYLDRFQALAVALANKQVLDENDIRAGRLFSEDVW